MIPRTLTAALRRWQVLGARAAVAVAATLAAGTVAVLASLAAGRLLLDGHGMTPARGYEALSLATGPVLRAAAGSVLYLALIALLVAAAYLVRGSGFGLNTAWIDHEVRGKGLAGELLFVGVAALFVAFALPRQIPSFLGGYAFGFVAGTVLALTASLLGCVVTFYSARLLGRRFVLAHAPQRVRRIDAFLARDPFTMGLLVRLMPLTNNFLTNLAAGVSGIGAAAFFGGSALGYVPETAIFALVGSGVVVDPMLRIGLSVLLLVASVLFGLRLIRRYARAGGDAPGL